MLQKLPEEIPYCLSVIVPSLFFIFGVCFGSFANVMAYRMSLKISIVTPSSFCPECKKPLKFFDKIPIFSYFFLKRKCRFCHVKISPGYFIVELICGGLFAATGLIYPFPVVIPFAIITFALVVIALVDIKTQEIPDSMVVVLIIAAIFLFFIDPAAITIPDALFGAATGMIPLFLIDKTTLLLVNKNGFGFGDMKLMGAAGLFLGWQGVLSTFFFAFIIGALYAIYLVKTKRAKLSDYIAFGPFLSMGVIISIWLMAFFETPFNLVKHLHI